MLSYLQDYENFYGPFRLFQFISVRAILAGVTALLIGFIVGPKIINFLRKLEQDKHFAISKRSVN